MIKLDDKVKIIKSDSAFYGCIGEVITQGNGSNWQVLLDNGIGIYYRENELEKVN
jgi:hypothetical protein